MAGLAVADGNGVLEKAAVRDRGEGMIRAADGFSVPNEDSVDHGRDGADVSQRRPVAGNPAVR